MAAFTSKATGNWTAADQSTWNEAGYPQAGDTAAIATGHNITADADITCTSITIAGTGTIVIPAATTRTINANVTNNGTATGGALVVGTGQGLIVNRQVTNTSSGYAVVSTGSGTITISNSGGNATSNSGSGRAVYNAGGTTGAVTIVGNVANTSSGYAVLLNSTGSHSFVGNISASAGYGFRIGGGGGSLTWIVGSGTSAAISGTAYAGMSYGGGGTLTISGNLTTSDTSGNSWGVIQVNGGTVVWTGSRALAAGEHCCFTLAGGTLNISNLALANSGTFCILKYSGTLTTTNAVITNQNNPTSDGGYAAIIGGSEANRNIITGPTLPAAGDVDSTAAQFGYAGALVTPTCLLPPVEDVEDGVFYGAGGTEFEGELAGGGYTYGDEDAAKVPVFATGAGTLVVPGMASGGLTLAKETGANARGGSGTCAKLTPPAGAIFYGYWDFYVPVTAAASTITFYWAKSAGAFDGLLKVSVWDTDDPYESPPPLKASEAVDITANDTDYHAVNISLDAAAAAGLCRVRIELKDGASSGLLYIDDISVAVT